MTVDRRRYGRQIRLADIGESGQAKLCSARVELHTSGFARGIEERYVKGAGMGVSDERSDRDAGTASTHADVATLGLRHPAAGEVGAGALHALVAFRAALLSNES